MRLPGGVDRPLFRPSILIDSKAGDFLPGCDQGTQGRTGRRVLNHSAAGTAGMKLLRKTEQVEKPIHHAGFHFGAGRTGLPEHPLNRETRTENVRGQGRPGSVRIEESKPGRVLPVSQTRHHQFVHVLQDRVEIFALFRRGRWKAAKNRSRLDIRIDPA